MRRGTKIDSAVFRQVLPNADLLDAVEDDKDREARIAGRLVVAASERSESRQAAKILYREWLKIIKEADLTWDFRRKADGYADLIGTGEGLREKWLIDLFYDNQPVSAFWFDNAEDEEEQDRLREMLEEEVDKLLLRTGVIGPRAKERLAGRTATMKFEQDDKGFTEVCCRVKGDGLWSILKVLRHFQYNGMIGHSYSSTLDDDSSDNQMSVGWDGDGADTISDITVNGEPLDTDQFDNDQMKWGED